MRPPGSPASCFTVVVNVVAIDWSGDATASGQKEHIWTALVHDGELTSLVNGHSRAEVISGLVALAATGEDLIVGLDFAFSFPAWFLRSLGVGTVEALWDLVAVEGEQWLKDCRSPLWGRPGTTRPTLPEHFRVTDSTCQPVAGITPKSVFQIGGAGAVGTGSIRGMPYLRQLEETGFAIWPFDSFMAPMVIEIYPRALTGAVRKSDPAERRGYLARRRLPASLRSLAEGSEDAFDAAVSAMVMAENVDDLRALTKSSDPVTLLEGSIWVPTLALGDWSGVAEVAGRPGPGRADIEMLLAQLAEIERRVAHLRDGLEALRDAPRDGR